MLKNVAVLVLGVVVVTTVLGLAYHFGSADHMNANARTQYEFPDARPLCLVELAPGENIWAMIDKLSPLKTGPVLIIPLYRQFATAGGVVPYAAAHPFMYQPGDDLEKSLSALEQRDRVLTLVLFAHGYFPASVPRAFRVDHVVDGREVTVIEVQRCVGDEWARLAGAATALLESDQFTVSEPEPRQRHPYSDRPLVTTQPYEMNRLVRGAEFTGRCEQYGAALPFGVWDVAVGRAVKIILDETDRRLVREFFGHPDEQPNK